MVSEEESAERYRRWTIPAPGKPLYEAAAPNFNLRSPAKVDTGNPGRGPLLLMSGGKDHTVPEVATRATLKQCRHADAVTDLLTFPGRWHDPSGWREVAEAALAWLRKQNVAAAR